LLYYGATEYNISKLNLDDESSSTKLGPENQHAEAEWSKLVQLSSNLNFGANSNSTWRMVELTNKKSCGLTPRINHPENHHKWVFKVPPNGRFMNCFASPW